MKSSDSSKLAALYENQSREDYYQNTEREIQKEGGKREVAKKVWDISKNAFEKIATGRNSISPERTNTEPSAQELLKVGKEVMAIAWREHEKDTPQELLKDPKTLRLIVAKFAKSPLESEAKSRMERSGKFRG